MLLLSETVEALVSARRLTSMHVELRTRTAKGGLGERLGLAPVGTPITP